MPNKFETESNFAMLTLIDNKEFLRKLIMLFCVFFASNALCMLDKFVTEIWVDTDGGKQQTK